MDMLFAWNYLIQVAEKVNKITRKFSTFFALPDYVSYCPCRKLWNHYFIFAPRSKLVNFDRRKSCGMQMNFQCVNKQLTHWLFKRLYSCITRRTIGKMNWTYLQNYTWHFKKISNQLSVENPGPHLTNASRRCILIRKLIHFQPFHVGLPSLIKTPNSSFGSHCGFVTTSGLCLFSGFT